MMKRFLASASIVYFIFSACLALGCTGDRLISYNREHTYLASSRRSAAIGESASGGRQVVIRRNGARIKGVYHVVKRGETLWRICKTYGVDLQEVAELNNIEDPSKIKSGQKIFIPGAKRVLKVDPKRDFGGSAPKQVRLYRGKLLWPVRGTVVSKFGVRNRRMHDGIDISVAEGTPVAAAGSGTVSFCGSIRGYGKVVIISHAGGLCTVYAHLKSFRVSKGQRVKAGQIIGYVGRSGNATGPHLHFEVRKNGKPRNPEFYLPRFISKK